MNNLELTAHHEAGHAVIAHNRGFEVYLVTLSENGSGITRFRGSGLKTDAALMTHAGPYAEGRWTYLNDNEYDLEVCDHASGAYWNGGHGDMDDLKALGLEGSIELEDQAEKLVEYFWPDIEKVAKALMDERTLNGVKFSSLLEQ